MRQPSGRALTTGPSITTRGAHSRRRAKALALQQGGEGAARGEQASTSAALATARAVGTAFGAAIAGVIAHAAGLGAANEASAVGPAVSAVFWACTLPVLAACVLMVRFVRLSQPKMGASR